MPYLKIRLSAAALLFLAGCTAPNFFTASPGNKANQEPPAASGPRPSAYTSSWSGTQNVRRTAQDAGAAAGAAAANERRIQDLLAVGERSQSTGDRGSARTAFEQVLRLAPGDAVANYQLAIMDDEEGRFADAETHYFTVMRQTPNDPNVLSSLGWSYYLQGRYDDSDRTLREALRYDPNHQFALNNLGMLYGARGDYDGALTIFRLAGSEADAQKALAMLKETAGTMPVAGEQYANTPMNSGAPNPGIPAVARPAGTVPGNTTINTPDPRSETATAESELKTPQARKFVEDFKRLKAENDKQQQQNRARLAQKGISAPSPWNNNRQGAANSSQRDLGPRDLERATSVQGLVLENPRYPPNSAAFPGAVPSQANRARQAEPADWGAAGYAGSPGGSIPDLNPGRQGVPGSQAIYEQSTGTGSQGASTQGINTQGSEIRRPGMQEQSRLPIITPAGGSPASQGNNSPTWNSLPPDDSFRGNTNSGNVPSPAGRLSDWPRNAAGNLGSTDQTIRNGTNQAAASGQFNAAQPQGRNSRQDAQTTAAELGLSAGSGGLGFPASNWPSSANGPFAGPGTGSSPPGGQNTPGSQIPPSGQNSLGGQNLDNSQSAGQPPAFGGQSQGYAPPSASPSNPAANNRAANNPASGLPPWPGRPLSGGSVPQAVVPSAQGVVYGSTGDSGMPNFYSGRPALPAPR